MIKHWYKCWICLPKFLYVYITQDVSFCGDFHYEKTPYNVWCVCFRCYGKKTRFWAFRRSIHHEEKSMSYPNSTLISLSPVVRDVFTFRKNDASLLCRVWPRLRLRLSYTFLAWKHIQLKRCRGTYRCEPCALHNSIEHIVGMGLKISTIDFQRISQKATGNKMCNGFKEPVVTIRFERISSEDYTGKWFPYKYKASMYSIDTVLHILIILYIMRIIHVWTIQHDR